MKAFTNDQLTAIQAEGNVLVNAGAGTGKTRTLVERCVAQLIQDPGLSIDQILLVTFTEAAAAEMRKRIADRLTGQQAAHPSDPRWEEQLALIEAAPISTLHSFCYRLVREHFHALDIDPRVAVMESADATLLAHDTLGELLAARYAGSSPEDAAVRALVRSHGGGNDENLRHWVLRLHAYTQSLPDPAKWLDCQTAAMLAPTPGVWLGHLVFAAELWRCEWLRLTHDHGTANPKALEIEALLQRESPLAIPDDVWALIRSLADCDKEWPKGKKTAFRKPLEPFFKELAFLSDLLPTSTTSPMQEDWDWVRGDLSAILGLAREFADRFKSAKRSLGAVDFADLEQHALTLLWDRTANVPTPLAVAWRKKLQLLFIDEYQDINQAQDCILRALSADGGAPGSPVGNRFLVGDIKQSIYRFRRADPALFRDYTRRWQQDPASGCVVHLRDNFRSHERILDFANRVFIQLMRADLGEIEFDATAQLTLGAPEHRPERRVRSPDADTDTQPEPPRVEWILNVDTPDAADDAGPNSSSSSSANADAGAPGTKSEREAASIARRLAELHASAFPVWDDALKNFRPVAWSDIAILLRSPRSKADAYARVFANHGIPLSAPRSGLLAAIEVTDLLNLLRLLDNPMQDLPLLAVLRSPLVGMTVNELALVRLQRMKAPLWLALEDLVQNDFKPIRPVDAAQETPDPSEADDPELRALHASAREKATNFLNRYRPWRELSRLGAIAPCLESILDQTGYTDWLSVQPGGEQAAANVERFLLLACDFDQNHKRGLYNFLRMLDARQQAEFDGEPASIAGQNAVRLMSIHQSKGLEFPVVVTGELGKGFNLDEARAPLILDEYYGLAAVVRPGPRAPYPSLAHWAAARRQHRETLAEEMRLLYVAFTRACDKLILCGSAKESELDTWRQAPAHTMSLERRLRARNAQDWLGPFLAGMAGAEWPSAQGANYSGFLSWQIVRDSVATPPASSPDPTAPQHAPSVPSPSTVEQLLPILEWRYPAIPATRQPAKASVTSLRRKRSEQLEQESVILIRNEPPQPARTSTPHPSRPGKPAEQALAAAERGTAHHLFQQFVRLESTRSEAELQTEAARMLKAGLLSREQHDALDFNALSRFWKSGRGARIAAAPDGVSRELPFTMRLSPEDFTRLGLPCETALDPDEFVVVQGVVDLYVKEPGHLWLVDLKTDRITIDEVESRSRLYAPQLALYALALARIHGLQVREAWLYYLEIGHWQSVTLPSLPTTG